MKELKLFLTALSNVLGKPLGYFKVVFRTTNTRYPVIKKCCLQVMDKDCIEIFSATLGCNISLETTEDTYKKLQVQAIEYLLKLYNVR